MSVELAEFIAARAADDRAVAVLAMHTDAVRPGEWGTEHHNSRYHSEPDRVHVAEDRSGHYWSVVDEVFIPIGEHIARWDPARVLVETDVKLRIAGTYLGAHDGLQQVTDPVQRVLAEAMLEAHGDAVRAAALPYAGHPEYRQEWRP